MKAVTDVESLFEAYSQAVYNKDQEAFAALFDEKVRVFDMWQVWSYDGSSAWMEMVRGWFSSLGSNRDVVSFSDIQIDSAGDMGFASAFVRFTAVSAEGKELRFLEDRLSWFVRKKGDSWKIVHQHTSGPIDFNTMKVMLTR